MKMAFRLISVLLGTLLISGCTPKYQAKKDGEQNKELLTQYVEEKYQKKFTTTYEYIGDYNTSAGRQPDVIVFLAETEPQFPFRVEYRQGEISDYYQSAYAGYLIGQALEGEILGKYKELQKVYAIEVRQEGKFIADTITSLEDIQPLDQKEVVLSYVLYLDENIDTKCQLVYDIYNYLATISDKMYLNISFAKNEDLSDFQKLFLDGHPLFSPELFNENLDMNFTAAIDIQINPIKDIEAVKEIMK